MNTAVYIDGYIKDLRISSMPKMDQVWALALALCGWPYIFGDWGTKDCTPSHRKQVYNSHPDQEGLIEYCQVLNGKKTGCYGCKWYPNEMPVRAFDCRGFTEFNLEQIYGWKLQGGGCTQQWNHAANWKTQGKIADGMPEGVILCLFYPSKKEPKKMQHTGLYYRGETIECGNGVQHSKTLDKRWTHWAIPACIEGDVPPIPDPPKPTIKRGSKGAYVVECQEELIRRGYDVGSSGADGIFGRKTESAVVAFQINKGLKADGIVGPDTWAALEGEPLPLLYTVCIRHLDLTQARALCNAYPNTEMVPEEGGETNAND